MILGSDIQGGVGPTRPVGLSPRTPAADQPRGFRFWKRAKDAGLRKPKATEFLRDPQEFLHPTTTSSFVLIPDSKTYEADNLLTEVRGDEGLDDDAVALRVSRDGTLLRMPAEERDGQADEQGWRAAAYGVVAQQGSHGTMLTQVLLPGFPNRTRPV